MTKKRLEAYDGEKKLKK